MGTYVCSRMDKPIMYLYSGLVDMWFTIPVMSPRLSLHLLRENVPPTPQHQRQVQWKMNNSRACQCGKIQDTALSS